MFQFAVFGLILSAPLLAFAAPNEEVDPTQQHHLLQISDKLSLTDDQRAQVAKIFEEQHQKVLAIHEESHARIRATLSAEQAEKWDAMKKAHEERRAQQARERR